MDMRKIVLGVLGLSIGLLANLECLLILTIKGDRLSLSQ